MMLLIALENTIIHNLATCCPVGMAIQAGTAEILISANPLMIIIC